MYGRRRVGKIYIKKIIEKKLILIIDEFPFIAATNPSIWKKQKPTEKEYFGYDSRRYY